MDRDTLQAIRAQTPGVAHGVHLLAAGSALMPRPVIDAIIEHTELEAKVGGYEAYNLRAETLDRVYASVASHLNADPTEIAIVENATTAWCQAFYALPLQRGSRVLTCRAEYAANYVALLQRAARDDLQIEVIPDDGDGVLNPVALEAMVDEDVSLIAITWIPTNGGLVNPAAAVGAIAQRHRIPYLLDACQAVGQVPIDVEAIGCDFLSATGRKFLRGPRGTGFLYVARRWLQGPGALEPAAIDHFAAPWVATERYELRPDARRFETWENSYALRAGLDAAVRYADSVGLEAIRKRAWALADRCRRGLRGLPGAQGRDKGRTGEQCAIVSFTLEGHKPREVVDAMRRRGYSIGITGPSSTRLDAEARELPDMLRVAPHYYNRDEDIDGFIEALGSTLAR